MYTTEYLGNTVTVLQKEDMKKQWEEKPHLILEWVYDYKKRLLICNLFDEVQYEALDGGYSGYNKYKKENNEWVLDKFVRSEDWNPEKNWISSVYGDRVGYFQPDHNRYIEADSELWPIQQCVCGFGPDFGYIDHLQRLGAILNGEDCAPITLPNNTSPREMLFETPDGGLTILKREATKQKTFYDTSNLSPDAFFYDHPQPCMMQPFTDGRQLSSHEELSKFGIARDIIEACKKGEYKQPKRPELQKYFAYPKD